MVSKDYATVHRHIEKIIPLVEGKPTARIAYPYLAPSYEGDYAGVVFGWDHHHMSMRLACGRRPEFLKHLVDNILSYQADDGYAPNIIHFTDAAIGTTPRFHAQPFLMQAALMYVDQTGDLTWAAEKYGHLRKYLGYYEATCKSP